MKVQIPRDRCANWVGAWGGWKWGELIAKKDEIQSADVFSEWPFAESFFRVWLSKYDLTGREPKKRDFTAVCQDKHGLSELRGTRTPDRMQFTKTYEDKAIEKDPSLSPKEYDLVLGKSYFIPLLGEFREAGGLIRIKGGLACIPVTILMEPYYEIKGGRTAFGVIRDN